MPDTESTAASAIESAASVEAESAPVLGESAIVEPEPSFEPDAVLLAAEEQARAALLEITPASTVGEVVGHAVHGEHVVSLFFATSMPGYPGWHWTVALSRLDGESAPNVLEVELLPGEGALLAPDWTPWSVRLADYEAAQLGDDEFDDESDDDESDEDESDDELDDDESDEDEDSDDDELDDDEDDPEDDDILDDQVILSDPDEDESDDDEDEDDSDEDDDDDDEDDSER